jgi:hypothetical protein
MYRDAYGSGPVLPSPMGGQQRSVFVGGLFSPFDLGNGELAVDAVGNETDFVACLTALSQDSYLRRSQTFLGLLAAAKAVVGDFRRPRRGCSTTIPLAKWNKLVRLQLQQ